MLGKSHRPPNDHQQEPKYYPDPPEYYPWYIHTAAGYQHWNFSIFWKKINQPDPMISLTKKTPLYMVHNGLLYGYRQHQETLKVDKGPYQGRVLKYEHLMLTALALVRRSANNNNTSSGLLFDPRLTSVATDPFPFFMVVGDFDSCEEKRWPIFTFATFAKENVGIEETCIPLAIPTYTRWNQRKKTKYWDAIFQWQEKLYPWKTKLNMAVWRGAATGYVYQYPYWRDLPRARLVQYSFDNPSLIDAGINESMSQRNETELEEMKSSGFMKERIEMRNFQKYKAIIDIDGNSWSSRFSDLLCMNSVVLKVTPEWVDYFYLQEVQPWVHYLPVHGNLSNLVEMVQLATSSDPKIERQMQGIVNNANAWCRTKMTPSQMSFDMSWIMASYVEVLNKENTRSGNFDKWKSNVAVSFNINNDVVGNSTTISNMNNNSRSMTTWNTENWVRITSTRKKVYTSYEIS